MHDVMKYWQTVRYLKPVQIYGRLFYRLRTPKVDNAESPSLRAAAALWILPARRRPSMMAERRLVFLNESNDLDQVGWDGPKTEKLWIYNLHYFDDLNAFAAHLRREWHLKLIADWLQNNPPSLGSGWEPYPLSLRIVNWIKWSCSGGQLSKSAVQSLAVQARWLSQRLERHLLGNHLFANAKALIFAGSFFEGPEAETWLSIGFGILKDQLHEQILADGGQFELTPMYHALAVEDVLDLINVLAFYRVATNGMVQEQIGDLQALVPQMLRWLQILCHPDGEICFFNDAAMGIAPTLSELLDYANRLGFPHSTGFEPVHWLKESGYVRLTAASAVLIADVARVGPDYLPAHSHADTLSFEMSLSGRRVIVNSGTSVYGTSPERLRQRGTAAHSTLVIDRLNSSEVWSGFRVARRARPFGVQVSTDGSKSKLSASHDGYKSFGTKIVHTRAWTLECGLLEVEDTVQGADYNDIEILFHLFPGLEAKQISSTQIALLDRYTALEVVVSGSRPDAKLTVEESTWHPEFGLSQPNKCLRFKLNGTLPLVHTTTFLWK